jgi:hypothetical protein
MRKFEAGDLVEIDVSDTGFTLCHGSYGVNGSHMLREHSHLETGRHPYGTLQTLGNMAVLITKVVPNKLDQPLLYEILHRDTTYFCKAILADKYFIKLLPSLGSPEEVET